MNFKSPTAIPLFLFRTCFVHTEIDQYWIFTVVSIPNIFCTHWNWSILKFQYEIYWNFSMYKTRSEKKQQHGWSWFSLKYDKHCQYSIQLKCWTNMTKTWSILGFYWFWYRSGQSKHEFYIFSRCCTFYTGLLIMI